MCVNHSFHCISVPHPLFFNWVLSFSLHFSPCISRAENNVHHMAQSNFNDIWRIHLNWEASAAKGSYWGEIKQIKNMLLSVDGRLDKRPEKDGGVKLAHGGVRIFTCTVDVMAAFGFLKSSVETCRIQTSAVNSKQYINIYIMCVCLYTVHKKNLKSRCTEYWISSVLQTNVFTT